MTKLTKTVQALAFPGSQRPTRTGLYMRRTRRHDTLVWSWFSARTKVWSAYGTTPSRAYFYRGVPSGYQDLDWFALPEQVPSTTQVHHLGGRSFVLAYLDDPQGASS